MPGSNQETGSAFPDGVTIEDVYVGGRRFELPQRYYDWSFIMAHFPAARGPVRRLLPPEAEALEPVEIVPGTAVVSFAAFEYRRMATLDPYKEVAIMVPVRHEPQCRVPLLPLLSPDRFDVGFWVHHLPVTTPQARDAGVEIWGLPKVVAEIEFEDVGWMRRCTLRENGQSVLTLDAAMGETRTESRQFYAFSLKNGQLLKTLVDTRAQYNAWFFGSGSASVRLGNHPIAWRLRELKIRDVPIAGLFAFSAKSRLHKGKALAPAPPPTMAAPVA